MENKNKSNYLLYAVLAIAFICGVLGVIAFVLKMTGKYKTPTTTGKRSGSGSGSGGLDSLSSVMAPEPPSIESYLKTIQSIVEKNEKKIDIYLNDGFKEKINKISSNSYRIKDMVGQIPSSWKTWDDMGLKVTVPDVVIPLTDRLSGAEPAMGSTWPSTT